MGINKKVEVAKTNDYSFSVAPAAMSMADNFQD